MKKIEKSKKKGKSLKKYLHNSEEKCLEEYNNLTAYVNKTHMLYQKVFVGDQTFC